MEAIQNSLKKTLTIFTIVLTTCAVAQNVGINSTGAAPDASAVLDVDAAPSNDKGLLIPRVALQGTNTALPITSPAVSLMVYNTAVAGTFPNNVIPGFYYWSGTKWVSFCNPANPPGEVMAFAGTTAPAGYLLCDGTAVSRTTYADLFAVIGIMYGAGNGTTTFNLPNYQGYFLRGKNNGAGIDPDAATRTNRGDGTTGDNVGTKQIDVLQDHNHLQGYYPGLTVNGGPSYQSYNYDPSMNFPTSYVQNARVSSETRPKNINVLYCIKY